MRADATSLFEYANAQLRGLCEVADSPHGPSAGTLLADLLGAAAHRPLSRPALWHSNVADDHTPVEFSMAFDKGIKPTIRILGETIPAHPGPAENMRAAQDLLDSWADTYGLALDRYERVRDLFLGAPPESTFSLWYSLVFKALSAPAIKIYFDPNCRGPHRAGELVAEALDRLNLGPAYQTLQRHAIRTGEGATGLDTYTFFALDLHDRPQSRVKVYVSHNGAEVGDVVRAAAAAPEVDPAAVERFCTLAGGDTTVFDNRPLISSYTFVEGDADRPSGYSLYVPIRGYVTDDAEARDRVLAIAGEFGVDPAEVDRAIAAVSRRDLADGVGLIAHVSLRLSAGAPGVTVYLSSEAYNVMPPRFRATSPVGGRLGDRPFSEVQ